MLFQVEMTVRLPRDMPPAQADELKAREKALAQELQRAGTWRHLWRIAGRYANVSISLHGHRGAAAVPPLIVHPR